MTPILFGIFGLIVGSFLNVVIHRVPLRQSIAGPSSHCPHCETKIKPQDNIPLLSYLLLGGRCRNCKERIPVRYPVVEGATGILFAAAALTFDGIALAGALVLVAVLISLAGTDLEYRLLPNAIVGPASVIGLVLAVLADPGRWWVYPLSALLIATVLYALTLFYPGGMGMGDVKMGGMLGAFLGLYAALAVFLGSFFGVIASMWLMASGRMRRRSAIPFGVFLALGGLVVLFTGPEIWRLYLDLVGAL